jgi:cobalt-zinc-cadmium efflux system membrane fusion protein
MNWKNKSDSVLRVFIAFFLFASFFSCKHGKQAAEENADNSLIHITKEQFDQMKMQTGTLQEVEFNEEIKVRGMTDVPPQSKASISPVVSGSVKDIFVRAGNRVKKGQPLLNFEGTEIIGLQQSYLEISEQLKSLELEYQRQKTLLAEKISSEKLFLEAESNYKKTTAACEGLKQQLLLLNIDTEKVKQGKISSSAVIYSPIAGDIIKINAEISKFIQPSDIVMEIVDTQQLQLYLSVFEKNIASIRQGQKVIFSIPESSNQLFTATITTIGKIIDRTERTAIVQALPASEARTALLTGMYIDAAIVLNAKNILAAPVDALIIDNKENFVLLLQTSDNNEYIFRKVKVKTGERNGDFMEIIPDEFVTKSSVILLKGVYNAI